MNIIYDLLILISKLLLMGLTLDQKISLLCQLNNYLNEGSAALDDVKALAKVQNPWFTLESIDFALNGISNSYLSEVALKNWTSNYAISTDSKVIGTVLAGNIPLVGFHDLISIFLANHKALIKLSEKDNALITHLIEKLISFDESVSDYFAIVNQLKGFDAVIATGSNNTGTYFRKYFSKKPNIIRGNRNGIAILSGNETNEDFEQLGKDIFTYFGLGCRNVSKIYVPKGYDFKPLLEGLHEFNKVNLHHKYRNNFDYNIALFLLNKQDFMNNGSLILKESEHIPSRIASCHYEFYDSIDELSSQINVKMDTIQCITSNLEIDNIKTIPLGKAQEPSLSDYADGIDTMEFLTRL
jgi:hypothetical protein